MLQMKYGISMMSHVAKSKLEIRHLLPISAEIIVCTCIYNVSVFAMLHFNYEITVVAYISL